MSDVIGEMVNRFLSWPLPDDVCVDAVACQKGAPHRTGTNLLIAAQARQMIEHVCAAALAAKDAEIESYRQWQEQALINCARRDCATRDKRLADLEARAERAEAEAAGLRADAERWRAVSAMMTHEHRGDAVGWTLSVILPGDDPDVAADAAIAARVGDEP